MRDPRIFEYRMLFLTVTIALFAAVIGVAQLQTVDYLGGWIVHAFWPISVLGAVSTVVWFCVCARHREPTLSDSSLEPLTRRLFDQLLPIALLCTWGIIMLSWIRGKPPPWASQMPHIDMLMVLIVTAIIVAFACYALFGIRWLGQFMWRAFGKSHRTKSEN